MSSTIWDEIPSVWITSFWGWSPETWGTVGFTDRTRRDTVIRNTTDPFIMVIYVTKGAKDTELRGKVVGFYIVSHTKGSRNEFTAPEHHPNDAGKWVFSLKATQAFSFLPEYRPDIDDFDPTMHGRARSVAAHSEKLINPLIQKLMQIPYVEVPVYGGSSLVLGDFIVPSPGQNMVSSGPINRSGYTVAGEPLDTPKELYALRLSGDASTFLGKPAEGRSIYKIGLSMSPKMRLETFRKAMPKGAFVWDIHRSTRLDRYDPYPSFEAAEAGERAMKEQLGRAATNWLGGEFYAATSAEIETAWTEGRKAALSYAKKSVGS